MKEEHKLSAFGNCELSRIFESEAEALSEA
jgi:hypothetical protein